MAEGKEEKKEEKGKDKMEGKEEEKKDKSEVINAVYRVNLHCQECGRKIKKHLMITEGVQSVDIDMEKGEIKAKGKIDPLKILKLIEKKSNKKVELISPKITPKENPTTTDKKPKETKEPTVRIITVKVHMHCDKCEADLRNRLVKHKGIFIVKTDKKAQTVTIEGTIEVEKLLSFLRKRVHKNAEVISIKEEKKEEKKDKEGEKKEEKKEKGKDEGKPSLETTKDKKEGEKKGEKKEKKDKEEEKKEEKKEKGKDEGKPLSEITKDKKEGEKKEEKKEKGKDERKSDEPTKQKEDIKSGESTKEKDDGKSSETTQIIEIQGDTKVEIKTIDNVPYIIHYVYAPQLFSDENPNSCSIL